MRIFISFLVLISVQCVCAQSSLNNRLDQAFKHENYTVVLDLLKKKGSSNLSLKDKYYMAEAYRSIDENALAMDVYEQIDFEKLNIDQAYFDFAVLLEMDQQYEKAALYYGFYLQKHPENIWSAWHMKSCSSKAKLP